MADVNSSLPIRTENPGDAVVKIADATIPAQQLKVEADGSVNANIQATDLDIRDLDFATDSVDVSGSSVSVSNTVTITATDLDIRNLQASQDNIAISDGTDTLQINTDGSLNVRILDGTPGTAINEYNSSSSVAGGATSTHTYTSTGNFNLTQIESTGSGKLKIEVKVNGVTKFVAFNSTANPNMQITLTQPILVTTGQTVTVERTNRENQSQDVYSTICGFNQ